MSEEKKRRLVKATTKKKSREKGTSLSTKGLKRKEKAAIGKRRNRRLKKTARFSGGGSKG